jgi:predicted RNA-binding protein with RPS1 domain
MIHKMQTSRNQSLRCLTQHLASSSSSSSSSYSAYSALLRKKSRQNQQTTSSSSLSKTTSINQRRNNVRRTTDYLSSTTTKNTTTLTAAASAKNRILEESAEEDDEDKAAFVPSSAIVDNKSTTEKANEQFLGQNNNKKKKNEELQMALERNQKCTGKVESVNRGGLILRVLQNKYKAFLPKSQMRATRLKSNSTTTDKKSEEECMREQVGKLIEVKFVEVTEQRVVVSEKLLCLERAVEKLPIGSKQTVVVTNLSDFGAFVEVSKEYNKSKNSNKNANDENTSLLSPIGVEGLIHISELSWNKVQHPRDVVSIGQELDVKVLEVSTDGQRINFSSKQMLDDPLMETLDTIMPVTMPELSFDEADNGSPFMSGDFDGEEGVKMEATLPGLPKICAELLAEEGVEAVIPGRKAVEKRVVSQDLELWLTNVQVEDGYNLLARSGRQVQEIHVVTSLNREAIKRAIKRATRATNIK